MNRIVIAATLLAATLTTAQAQDVRRGSPDWSGAAEQGARWRQEKEARRKALEERLKIQEPPTGRSCSADPYCGMSFEEVERYNQEKAKEKAKAAAVAAERERQKREYEAQLPAREQAAREVAQERARIAALPSTRLLSGYAAFAYVRWCYVLREGYADGYINDAELERATTAVKAIEAQTTNEDAAMNTDDVWKQAMEMMAGRMTPRNATRSGQIEVCQDALQQLLSMSPAPVYPIAKP